MRIIDQLEREVSSSTKAFYTGTHRIRPPEETFADFGRFMSVMGITRIANITGLDYIQIPVWQSIRPNARALSTAQGKGATHAAAKVSAMMEAMEGWHAERIELPLRYDSYAAMARRFNTIDLMTLGQRRPGRPRADYLRLWVEGWDLIQERPIWVPLRRVMVAFTESRDEILQPDSNGLASGNSFGEATVHALCELIERDAWSLWLLNPDDPDGKRSQIDLATVTDENCRGLIERFAAARLNIAAYDLTSDLELPTFAAVVSDRPGNHRALGHFWGYGCHLDPAVALSRALTEAAQSRVSVISGARDDVPESYAASAATDEELLEIEQLITTPPPPRAFDRPSVASTGPLEDLAVILARLRRAGVRSVGAVSLARDEFKVPVVKLVSTDLEGYGCAPNTRGRRLVEAGQNR